MKQCYNPLLWKQMSDFDSSVHKRVHLKKTACTQIVKCSECIWTFGLANRTVQWERSRSLANAMWLVSASRNRSVSLTGCCRSHEVEATLEGLFKFSCFCLKSSEQKNSVSLGTLLPGQKPPEPASCTGLQILTATTPTFSWAVRVQRYFNI